jgi:hypothetical protein
MLLVLHRSSCPSLFSTEGVICALFGEQPLRCDSASYAKVSMILTVGMAKEEKKGIILSEQLFVSSLKVSRGQDSVLIIFSPVEILTAGNLLTFHSG